jgi:hypothetical protein
VFLQAGHLVRPFSRSAGVRCRGYSQPLQRRITDFGADEPFGKILEKLQEHYGITVPESSARSITEYHAQRMSAQAGLAPEIPESAGVEWMIAETDGTMIPIVETSDTEVDGSPVDKRKTRKGRWKEARLAFAHPKGSVTPVFGCTLGGTEDAGNQLLACAIRAGMGQDTKVHCVGDGAVWIADQVNRVFGTQATFLVDFYHLCEYLSSAAVSCAPGDQMTWFRRHKHLIKNNQVAEVLEELHPHLEPESVPDEKAPVRRCSRYIRNRPGQFDYKRAVEHELPIGSGEIESAHRYIIQKRLKIAGAWWKENNAQNMLVLRTLRANGDWESYWKNNKATQN